jgi:hypothetical protein
MFHHELSELAFLSANRHSYTCSGSGTAAPSIVHSLARFQGREEGQVSARAHLLLIE